MSESVVRESTARRNPKILNVLVHHKNLVIFKIVTLSISHVFIILRLFKFVFAKNPKHKYFKFRLTKINTRENLFQ